jgi:ketohexokinase
VRILAVGIATLDVVNEVAAYPAEDAEVRALRQTRRRGGNATNTLVVLAQLGHRCDWAGVLADEPDAALVLDDLARHRIGVAHCQHHLGGKLPTSYVTLSAATGSRTIVHYRDLPEYPAAAFAAIPLQDYDWVHFEGRAVVELEAMLRWLRAAGGPPCSLEVEKPRPGIERLFPLADLLLFSRHYARARGYTQAAALLQAEVPAGTPASCAWGDAGAWGRSGDGQIQHSPACPPPRAVDTLGAGDVFNAAVIDAHLRGASWAECIAAGCRLAGRKCGQPGLDGLQGEGAG